MVTETEEVYFKAYKLNQYKIQEMNDWVNTICRVCGMAQENRDRGPPYGMKVENPRILNFEIKGPRLRLPNQPNGNSLSSSPSFDSLIDAPSDVTSEDRRENSQPVKICSERVPETSQSIKIRLRTSFESSRIFSI